MSKDTGEIRKSNREAYRGISEDLRIFRHILAYFTHNIMELTKGKQLFSTLKAHTTDKLRKFLVPRGRNVLGITSEGWIIYMAKIGGIRFMDPTTGKIIS